MNIIRIIRMELHDDVGKVIDIGCGVPYLVRSIDKFYPDLVTGVDLEPGLFIKSFIIHLIDLF